MQGSRICYYRPDKAGRPRQADRCCGGTAQADDGRPQEEEDQRGQAALSHQDVHVTTNIKQIQDKIQKTDKASRSKTSQYTSVVKVSNYVKTNPWIQTKQPSQPQTFKH